MSGRYKSEYEEMLKRAKRDAARLRKRITENALTGRDFRVVLNIGSSAISMYIQEIDHSYWRTVLTPSIAAVVNENQRQIIHQISSGNYSIPVEDALKVLDIIDE